MMDFVPGGQLGHRLLALSRLQRHLGLESWAVLPTSLRHFLLLPDSNSCPQFRSGTLTRLPVAVTLLSGKGGVGKSRLALQLAAAIAGGAGSDANWGGPALSPNITESVPVIFASWEDPPAIISRRLSQISGAGAPWVNPTMPLYIPGEAELGLTGSGPLYGTQERWGHCELTPLAHRLFEAAEKVDAGLLVLDSAAAIYSANENDRAEVRGFLSALARRAYEGDRSVLLLAHPPKSGSDYSGSTDWLAGVRALWTLGTEP